MPASPAPRPARPYDIVLFGATGFTGRLVAEHLATAAQVRPLRWALAGRDRARLEQIHRELGPAAATGPAAPAILVADAHDAAAMTAIAAQARVVCTTVGPYALHGNELVAACARQGTDYCDLTGEVLWMRRMIDAHHEQARASGARIVHTCGFDSIPSDLGVLFLQDEMQRRHGGPASTVTAFVGQGKGGFSGGTAASALNVAEEMRDPRARALFADPYGLDPTPGHAGPDGRDPRGIGYDRTMKMFTAPFLMAGVNTRVVRRSQALLGQPWGSDFRYREVMGFPAGARGLLQATALTVGIGVGVAALAVPKLRPLIARRLPQPGTGPSAEVRNNGHFVVRLLGERSGDHAKRVLVEVSDRADPGYGSTSKMLAQSALSLAQDALPAAGGVLTPAASMGLRLVERLRTAGLRFEVAAAP